MKITVSLSKWDFKYLYFGLHSESLWGGASAGRSLLWFSLINLKTMGMMCIPSAFRSSFWQVLTQGRINFPHSERDDKPSAYCVFSWPLFSFTRDLFSTMTHSPLLSPMMTFKPQLSGCSPSLLFCLAPWMCSVVHLNAFSPVRHSTVHLFHQS